MKLTYIGEYNAFFEIVVGRKSRQNEKMYNIVDSEGDVITSENAVDGVEYDATLKEDYIDPDEQKAQIEVELDTAIRFSNAEEITRCQQAYADLNNGILIETKLEVETERDAAKIECAELISDVEMYLKALMA